MDPADIQHPRFLELTCVDCQQRRALRATDGDPENHLVIYECMECGHEVDLSL